MSGWTPSDNHPVWAWLAGRVQPDTIAAIRCFQPDVNLIGQAYRNRETAGLWPEKAPRRRSS